MAKASDCRSEGREFKSPPSRQTLENLVGWLLILVAFAGAVLCDNDHPFWGIFLAVVAGIIAIVQWEKQDSGF